MADKNSSVWPAVVVGIIALIVGAFGGGNLASGALKAELNDIQTDLDKANVALLASEQEVKALNAALDEKPTEVEVSILKMSEVQEALEKQAKIDFEANLDEVADLFEGIDDDEVEVQDYDDFGSEWVDYEDGDYKVCFVSEVELDGDEEEDVYACVIYEDFGEFDEVEVKVSA